MFVDMMLPTIVKLCIVFKNHIMSKLMNYNDTYFMIGNQLQASITRVKDLFSFYKYICTKMYMLYFLL